MKILLFILIIFALIKTVSYGIFELKENKNKFAALIVISLAIISCILTSIMVYIR